MCHVERCGEVSILTCVIRVSLSINLLYSVLSGWVSDLWFLFLTGHLCFCQVLSLLAFNFSDMKFWQPFGVFREFKLYDLVLMTWISCLLLCGIFELVLQFFFRSYLALASVTCWWVRHLQGFIKTFMICLVAVVGWPWVDSRCPQKLLCHSLP